LSLHLIQSGVLLLCVLLSLHLHPLLCAAAHQPTIILEALLGQPPAWHGLAYERADTPWTLWDMLVVKPLRAAPSIGCPCCATE
jgi:hypothetical protein